MPTLREMENRLGVKDQIVDGPYRRRRMGYPLHRVFFKKVLDLSKMRRRYELSNLPVIGRLVALIS